MVATGQFHASRRRSPRSLDFDRRALAERNRLRTYSCTCGNQLFYDNSRCLRCDSELAFCPACRRLAPLTLEPTGLYRCGHVDCGAELIKCDNYRRHQVCNRAIRWRAHGGLQERLCDCCRYNRVIPDLSAPGNLDRWRRLEAAKRRMFYGLDLLGLRYGTAEDGFSPPLSFEFKADAGEGEDRAAGQPVMTGHSNGCITINIREADDAEREKLRVQFGEDQRTLLGHFRHEMGHFYWELLVRGRVEDECKAVFGDHRQPTYAEALERHYRTGPPGDWRQRYVSAYATMHPWEDFAETFSTFLDMVCLLDTAHHLRFSEIDPASRPPIDAMVLQYQRMGIALNEMNRALGLGDAVPIVPASPVVEKLRFIHRLAFAG
jgi:hypothetical protein